MKRDDDDDGGTSRARHGALVPSVGKETSFAPQSNATFVEPWLRRVRDVDDDTLAGLLHQLIGLRRLRNVVAAVCCAVGMSVFFDEKPNIWAKSPAFVLPQCGPWQKASQGGLNPTIL